jgi:hypothetical protein
MAAIIYTLCAVAALLCACLLLRAYHNSRYRLLLWGGLCFTGLTLTNMLLVVDKLFLPLVDLSPWRHLMTLISVLILLYGLVMDTE